MRILPSMSTVMSVVKFPLVTTQKLISLIYSLAKSIFSNSDHSTERNLAGEGARGNIVPQASMISAPSNQKMDLARLRGQRPEGLSEEEEVKQNILNEREIPISVRPKKPLEKDEFKRNIKNETNYVEQIRACYDDKHASIVEKALSSAKYPNMSILEAALKSCTEQLTKELAGQPYWVKFSSQTSAQWTTALAMQYLDQADLPTGWIPSQNTSQNPMSIAHVTETTPKIVLFDDCFYQSTRYLNGDSRITTSIIDSINELKADGKTSAEFYIVIPFMASDAHRELEHLKEEYKNNFEFTLNVITSEHKIFSLNEVFEEKEELEMYDEIFGLAPPPTAGLFFPSWESKSQSVKKFGYGMIKNIKEEEEVCLRRLPQTEEFGPNLTRIKLFYTFT
jgi:hypothetical protein